MSKVRFTLDHAGLERLLSSNEAEAALGRVAEDVRREWERGDPRQKSGGHQPPKIEVGPPGRDDGVAVVPVFTNDSIWHLVEFGSANNAPYRPATRAAHAAGLELKDSR